MLAEMLGHNPTPRFPLRVARRTVLGAAVSGVMSGACDRKSPTAAESAQSGPTAPGVQHAAGSDRHHRRGATTARQPAVYLPHGGGPCFFMDWPHGPKGMWEPMAAWLRGIDATLPERPRALLVISAHWEAPLATVTSHPKPALIYDYYGFPPHTYELEWPAPGSQELAQQVRELLEQAGIDSASDPRRGFDHGVFIPLKLSYPEAQIPTVQLSLIRGLEPESHLAIGRALSTLRDAGVLILGSGMSYHNMKAFMTAKALPASESFDTWLGDACQKPAAQRDEALRQWEHGPEARACHPREEHLLPLMVVAGAAQGDAGKRVFSDQVMGARVSAFQFG